MTGALTALVVFVITTSIFYGIIRDTRRQRLRVTVTGELSVFILMAPKEDAFSGRRSDLNKVVAIVLTSHRQMNPVS
jgi:hypothetical protein